MKISHQKPSDISWSKENPERWAPFGKDGGLIEFAGYGFSDIHWREVSDPIDLTLKFESVSRGSSSIRFWWKDIITNAKFPMFSKDFTMMFTDFGSIELVISGNWKIQKRGANYGIKLIKKVKFNV